MKEKSLLIALGLVILVILLLIFVIGRGNKKIDITDNNINVESCDKYFEMVDCILENYVDESYTEEMRDALREDVKSMQANRENLDRETLDYKCSNELSKFTSNSAFLSELNEAGCSIK